ncbi:hypothetical protein WDZ17_00835 [Pseudokineococcus basanitobsidens]|uniref:Uncharacterized protein n=1 Tax=Pseudokineococcus basanitobsidens TaxID=1926649 RepID=A0ABU8RFI5_9ACTN
MAVRDLLARWALRGAAVLLVEVPGGWAVRVAVQRALTARGWREATSPADADALVVCGVPGGGWDEVLGRTWAQLPGPRARASVRAVEDVAGVLDALAVSLGDDDAQRADAASRGLAPEDLAPGDDMHPGGMELAGGEDDLRDGLEMDVLRVPLGPVLPCWPAGLVLRTVLSGDVVVRGRVEVLPGGARGPAVEPGSVDDVARRLDAAAQVLRLAGAVDLAARAVRLRDAVIDVGSSTAPSGGPSSRTSTTTRHQERSSLALRRQSAGGRAPSGARRRHGAGEGAPSLGALRRLHVEKEGDSQHFDDYLRGVGEVRGRVERSRVLAWALRAGDVATSSPTSGAESDAAQASAPGDLRDVGLDGQCRTRDDVRTLLLDLLDPDAHDDDPGRRTRAALEALPERLVGVDVVTARLLVAALDLRTDALDADDLAALAPRDDDSDDDSDDASDEHAHHGHAHG